MLRSTAFSALLIAALVAPPAFTQGGAVSGPAVPQAAPQAVPSTGGEAPAQQRATIGRLEVFYGIPKALAKAEGALRLATYNVENLFDEVDDPDNPFDQDEVTSKARREALAKAIRELDADILCLQEVESEECLIWFRDNYLGGMGYDHAASKDTGYGRGIEQSILSRVPIVKAQVFTGEDLVISDMESRRTDAEAKRLGGTWARPASPVPDKFQRSPLKVDLRTKDGYALTVFIVHFKAGRDFSHQRELEALQVEAWVREELSRNPDANIAVVGDFNGIPGDMNVKALRMSDTGLVSGYDWRFDKRASRERYATHASGRSIDFIVMSPGLAADAVPGSYFVLGTPHAGSDWDWRRAKENPPPDGYASDHYAVAIDFRTTPDRPASAFTRAESDDGDATPAPAAAAPAARGDLRSDATPPTKEDLERFAKPEGSASDADRAAARALREAGWAYLLPYPKSRTAAWPRRGGNSTWWPGYWKNEKTGATSRAAPSEKDRMRGDGKAAPLRNEFTETGAPGRVSWVEWLCSKEGASEN